MNILWITMESILPCNSGGRIGIFKRLEQISKTEKIFLFYPYDDPVELNEVENLKRYCAEVHPYYRRANRNHALLNLWKYPFTVGSRDIRKMKQDISDCLINNKINVINVDFPHMCVNLLGLDLRVPIVLNEHNIEWKIYRKIAVSQNNLIKKFAYFADSYRLKRYEKKVLTDLPINAVTFVSDKDMAEMQSTICKNKVCSLIPVGADIPVIETITPHNEKNIIFVGKMSYAPNVEAVTWFAGLIFPAIKLKVPDAKFIIVGKEPTKKVMDLACEDIVVTGAVNDVSEYYLKADLVVLPLLNGGGVKVKLLEAVSYKKNIVSTSVGVEGTVYADGVTIPVEDDPVTFAEKCVQLILFPETAKVKIKKTYGIFLENYTWEKIGLLYKRALHTVAEGIGKNEDKK
jgi:glycosyltransferase involved in cell wall biosynthesis